MVVQQERHKRSETDEEAFDKLRPAYMRAARKEARMMRCEHCGGHAIPGLAHIHGNPCRPLCRTCTQLELERQAQAAKLEKQVLCEACINRSLPRAA